MPGVVGDAQELSHSFPNIDVKHADFIKKKHLERDEGSNLVCRRSGEIQLRFICAIKIERVVQGARANIRALHLDIRGRDA